MLRTAKGNAPITITPWCIVYPHSGGTMVHSQGERIHLVNGYGDVLEQLGIQQSPVPTPTPALEPVTNSGGGGKTSMSITINDYELVIDPECTMDVAQGVMENENCRTILATWLKVYHDYHDKYPPFINAVSMGCIYFCRQQPKKSCEVLTWHFTSNHRRAKWYRDQGMFDPAVSLKRLEQNWGLSLEEQSPTTTTGRPSALPQYDDEGNLI